MTYICTITGIQGDSVKFKIIINQQTPKCSKKSIEDVLKDDKQLIEKFISFSMRQKRCSGLASNQVSVDGKRIDIPFFTEKDKNGWSVKILPIITKYSGVKYEAIEGCLTFPGKELKTKRFDEITIKYYNLNGEVKIENYSGYKAQVCQHEVDHLLGVKENFFTEDN